MVNLLCVSLVHFQSQPVLGALPETKDTSGEEGWVGYLGLGDHCRARLAREQRRPRDAGDVATPKGERRDCIQQTITSNLRKKGVLTLEKKDLKDTAGLHPADCHLSGVLV